jgi:hypothetical protein
MESLPPSYKPLKKLYNKINSERGTNIEDNTLFDEMAERVLAICVVIFYRVGFIPLDAHLGNWMYDVSQPIDQFKVRAIDFGRIISRITSADIDTIVSYIRDSLTKTRDAALLIHGLARLLKVEIKDMKTAELCGTKIGEIIKELNKLIRHNQNGSILWHPTGPRVSIVTHPVTDTSPEQTMDIDSCMILIHRIMFIIVLVDSCYNYVKYNKIYCQLRYVISSIFGFDCNNLREMIVKRVYIELEDYLKGITDYNERTHIIQSYANIRDHIGNYLRVSSHRGLFDDTFLEEISPATPRTVLEASARMAALPPPPIPPPPPARSPPHSPERSPPHSPERSPPHSPERSPPHSPRMSPKYSPRKSVLSLSGGRSIRHYRNYIKSRKNRKSRKSRKNRKSRKSRKNRKSRKIKRSKRSLKK